jgi:hypothetical protein
MPEWVIAVGSLVLGSVGTYLLEMLRERRAESRETKARRNAFHRETLSELQDQLLEWERVIRVLFLRKLRDRDEHSGVCGP